MTVETGLDLVIEPGGIADMADVMLAMGDAFDPEFGEAWTEAQCAGVLGMPGSWLLIARGQSEPAGFALLRKVADEAELLLIAEVRDGNPALVLYRGAGFVQVGRRRGYYRGRSGKVFDALTFKRQLSVN